MATSIPMNAAKDGEVLSDNAFIRFIKDERKNVITRVLVDFPALSEEEVADIFQEVCISVWEKAQVGDLRLTCSLFYYMYRCCWNLASHATRNPKENASLPEDNLLHTYSSDDYEPQPILQNKVDELLDTLFDEVDERDLLLEQVARVVCELPKPCDKILYGMYGTPKMKQEAIAKLCGFNSADVVKTTAMRCKEKFRKKFNSIYESFKRGEYA